MKIRRTVYREGGYDALAADKGVMREQWLLEPGLASDIPRLAADGVSVTTFHYAGLESVAVWNVNGLELTEPCVNEGRFWTCELAFTSVTPGPLVVSCNGSSATVEVV